LWLKNLAGVFAPGGVDLDDKFFGVLAKETNAHRFLDKRRGVVFWIGDGVVASLVCGVYLLERRA